MTSRDVFAMTAGAASACYGLGAQLPGFFLSAVALFAFVKHDWSKQ